MRLRIAKTLRAKLNRIALSSKLTRIYDRVSPVESLGDRGELAASRHLRRQGMIVLQTGYHDKLGEIDVIAVDERTVVFVEVKTRTSDVAGDPTEAVDQQKQEKIVRTAIGYLKWHGLLDYSVRFDVISVIWPEDADPQITHYENAFETTGQFQIF